jgi:hypothetical protein
MAGSCKYDDEPAVSGATGVTFAVSNCKTSVTVDTVVCDAISSVLQAL